MILKHENIGKIATGQGDDYTTGCLLDYPYFKIIIIMIIIIIINNNNKMIAADL